MNKNKNKSKKRIIFLLIIIILIILLLRLCSGPEKVEVNVPQPADPTGREMSDTLSPVDESPADTFVVDNAASEVKTVTKPKRNRSFTVQENHPDTPSVQTYTLCKSDTASVAPIMDSSATEVSDATAVTSTVAPDASDTTDVTSAVTSVEPILADTENIMTDANTEDNPLRNTLGVLFTPDFYGDSPVVSIQWRHFFNMTNSLDIRAAYQFNWGPELSAIFEWNVPFKDSGLSFYAGPGIHIGLITNYRWNRDSCLNFGFAGAAGFEYNFPHSPLALSLDWHPYLTWQPSVDNKAVFGWRSFQLGAKYCF